MKRLFSFLWTGIHPEGCLLPLYFLILVWLLYEIYVRKRGIGYKKKMFAIFGALFLAVLAESCYGFRNFQILFLKLVLLTLPFETLWPGNGKGPAGSWPDFKKTCLWIWGGMIVLEAVRICRPHHFITWVWLYSFFPVLLVFCFSFLFYFRIQSYAAVILPSGCALQAGKICMLYKSF